MSSRTETKLIVALAVLALVTIVASKASEITLFNRDAGVFTYIGEAILRGEVPYRDVWDNKPPGIYYVYALIFKVLSPSVLSMHIGDGVAVTIGGLLFYGLSRTLNFGSLLSALGAFLYVLFVAAPVLDTGGDSEEVYMQYPLLLGFLLLALFLRGSRSGKARVWLLVGSGIALGLAFLFFPTVLLHLGVAVVVLALRCLRPQEGWAFAGLIGLLLAGFLVPIGITGFYFWSQQALPDLVEQVFLYQISYGTKIELHTPLLNLRSAIPFGLYNMTVLWLLGVSAIAYIFATRQWRNHGWEALLVLLFAADALSWAANLRFRGTALVMLAPSLTLLSVYMLSQIQREKRLVISFRHPVAAILAVSLLILTLVPMSSIWFDGARKGRLVLRDGFHVDRGFPEELITIIDSNTGVDDYVYMWGYPTRFYFLEDRKSPTRYLYNHPMVGRFGGIVATDYVPTKHIERFMEDLSKSSPRIVVTYPYGYYGKEAPYLDDYLDQHYRLLSEVAPDYKIYVRNSS